jgi:hypothetical protein
MTRSKKGAKFVDARVAGLTAVGIFIVSTFLLSSFVSVAASALPTYPVTLTVAWTDKTWPVGSSPSQTVHWHNGGSQSITCTGGFFRFTHLGKTYNGKLPCNFTTVPPGGSGSHTYSLYPYHVKSTDCNQGICGSYQFTLWYEGKVGSTLYMTKTVSFKACVVHC